MKKMLMILFVVVFNFPVFGQQAIDGKSVNRGLIYTADADTIEGQYIVFLKDSMEFYLENSQTRYVLGLDQVNEVLEYDGHYGTAGTWVGAFVGAGIGVAVSLGMEETETSGYITTTSIPLWPILVFTVVGTFGGYLIGAQIEDWNTVYSKSAAFLKNFNIKQNNFSGLEVSYRVYF